MFIADFASGFNSSRGSQLAEATAQFRALPTRSLGVSGLIPQRQPFSFGVHPGSPFEGLAQK
jgi:hypothetical protein